ncbi:MAG: hypothetical protein AAGJ40_16505 [Planctomycetota bacterium]
MNPIRRLFLLVLGCVAQVHAACADDRPNVLIMMADPFDFIRRQLTATNTLTLSLPITARETST